MNKMSTKKNSAMQNSSRIHENRKIKIKNITNNKKSNFNVIEKNNTTSQTQAHLINQIRNSFWSNFESNNFSLNYTSETIIFFMILLLQASSAFSKDFSRIYRKDNEDNKIGLFKENSFTNAILSSINPINFSNILNPIIFFIFIFGFLLMKIFLASTFLKKNLLKPIYLSFESSDGDIIFKSFFINFIKFYIKYFDLIFLITNCLALNTLFCRKISISYIKEFQEGVQGNSIKSDYINIIEEKMTSKTVIEEKFINLMNNEIGCRFDSTSGAIGSIAGVFLVIANFILKYLFDKIWNHSPSLEIKRSKYGNVDWLVDLVITVGMALRGIVVQLDDLYYMKLISFFYLFLLVITLIITWRNLLFYHSFYLALKKFQLIFQIIVFVIQIMSLNNFWNIFTPEKEFSLFFLILLLSVFGLKLSFLGVNKTEKIIDKIFKGEMEKKIQKEEILEFYFLTIKYMNSIIESNRTGNKLKKEDLRIWYLNNTYFEYHKTVCCITDCICRVKDLEGYIKQKPLHIPLQTRIFSKNSTPLRSLLFCERVLRDHCELDKSPDPVLINTYAEFLIDYLGKPVKVTMMLGKLQKLTNLKNTELDFEIIKDKMDSSSAENLFNGSLSMAKYSKSIDNELEKKRDYVDAQDHVLFLNSVERLKNIALKCGEIKLEFLEGIRGNPVLKESFEKIKEFTILKKRVGSLSEALVYKSKGQYTPLLHIMWKYTRDVCQCFICSRGYLHLYKKSLKSKMKNLNMIFYKDEIFSKTKKDDFSTLYVSGEKENFHQILYCTSNLFDLTGKKLFSK